MIERLGDEDIDQDLGRCPVSEILGRLCDYLEIQPIWQRWRREPWAMDEARHKVPGSPYAEPPPAEPEPAEEPEARPEPAEAGPEPAAAKPDEPKSPEPKAAEAKPEDPPAPPVRSLMDRLRYPTQDEIRAEEARKLRIRALHPPDY
jgi:hypothetical protein